MESFLLSMLQFLLFLCILHREAVVISVKNISGFVSVNSDGSWVCEGGSKHKAERFPDPVSHGSNYSFLVSEFSILQAFLLLRMLLKNIVNCIYMR